MPDESPRSVADASRPAADFPLVPAGWYYVAPVESLRVPVEVTLGEREFVAFVVGREAHVLDGRCPHFSARLSRGTLVDGCLTCPLHGWRFRPDGTCESTPSGDVAPEGARVTAYPTAIVGGHLFFHVDPRHVAAMPFLDGVDAEALISAPPFAFDVAMPWWLVSANGFDSQHFHAAHDRRLIAPPEVLRADTVFEARATFEVAGGAWRDRATRLVAGRRVEMTVRSVGGTLVLVTSRFARTVTYGVVSIHPRSEARSQVRAIIWKHPRLGALRAFDALDVRVRASFIRAFLEPDIVAGEGIRYQPERTVAADALLTRYLDWVRARG
jgi:phenylpropionate dioxygenase-like ring-hydroxylating dioxygenase large terminal subunit